MPLPKHSNHSPAKVTDLGEEYVSCADGSCGRKFPYDSSFPTRKYCSDRCRNRGFNRVRQAKRNKSEIVDKTADKAQD